MSEDRKKLIGKALKKAGELLDDEPSEQALLTEYSSCQQDNIAASSNYWTVTGIFIAVSSALLGGIIYAITSTSSFIDVLQSDPTSRLSSQNHVTLVLASIMGIIVIMILSSLRLRLRRVRFLQQLNFERMREIESKLGIRKSWRVHGIDHWEIVNAGFDERITNENKKMLLDYKSPNWWAQKKSSHTYASSGVNAFNGIYTILIFLWALLVTNALALLASFPITRMSVVIVIALLSGIITFFVFWFTRIRRE